jgi:hypothetical protein
MYALIIIVREVISSKVVGNPLRAGQRLPSILRLEARAMRHCQESEGKEEVYFDNEVSGRL